MKEKISTLGYDMHHEGWGFHVNFFCFGDVFRLDIVAVDSPIGRLGLSVCYDLRFPEMYQLLRFQHEAQVISGNITFLLKMGCLQSKFFLCFTTSRYYWCLQHSQQ